MKAIRHSLLPIGFTALLTAPVLAIEPPEDNAPPPAVDPAAPQAEAPAAPAADQPKPQPQAAGAYLGIGTSAVPDALAAHLNLQGDAAGVLIRSIDPNGPAAKAGLVEHDVVTRVAGQAVGSHADLVAEIRKHQPGAEIAIDFIHQGKPANKSVTLVPRPDGAAAAPVPNQLDDLMLQGMPEEQAKRIREAVERQLRAFEEDAPAAPGDPMKQLRELQKQMRERMGDALKQGGNFGGIKIQGGATLRMMDPEGSIELNSKDGGKEATIRDKDGKVTWSGPWDTEQDKAAAPPEVRARLDKLKIDENFLGEGLRFRLGGQGLIEPEPADEEQKAPKDQGDAEQPAPAAPKSGPIK